MNRHNYFRIGVLAVTAIIILIATPLWAATAKKPNILLIVADDMGYSDLGSYGSEIRTPHLDKLAQKGVRFTDFYVSSLCAPTRAMLLTGVDNHQNGLGTMPPGHAANQYLKPGYEGGLNSAVMTLPEILRKNGYHTYMAGKWHLGHHSENFPVNKGFEKSFAFIGGGASHFNDAFPLSEAERPITFYTKDNEEVKKLPEDFYSSDYFADIMIEYITKQKDDAPFFGYLAFTAPHDPLHVPDRWVNKYKGRYYGGYDSIRKERLARMKTMGLVDESVPYNPGTEKFTAWEKLSDTEQKIEAREMEIYASMIENMDYHIGLVVDALKKAGKYDNTLIIFMSDNGANPKEALFYPGQTEEYMAKNYDNSLKNMGKRGSFISQGGPWAEVSNTPFTYFKTTTGEGGIHSPFIVSGPDVYLRGVRATGGMHVCDIVPTLLDLAGVSRPDSFKGKKLAPFYGKSVKGFLSGDRAHVRDTEKEPLHFEMFENRAIIKGNWKALMLQPPYVEKPVWQLFNLVLDPLEKNDFASQKPDKLQELISEWNRYAKEVGYIKAEGGMLIEKIGPEKFYEFEKNE
jgi:arylsulfatase A-like enzyme